MPLSLPRREPKVHVREGVAPKRPLPGANSTVNFLLLAAVLVLLVTGVITLYAVTRTSTEYSLWRQIGGIGIGIAAMAAFWVFDYRRFSEWFVPLFVLDIVLILLPMVPGLGVEVNGATSWIRLGPLSFQPSEIAKPVTIVAIAAFAARFEGQIDSGTAYLKLLAALLVPVALLVREDFGSALVIFIVGFSIICVAGAAKRWILITVITLAVAAAGALCMNGWISDWTGGKVQLIKPYQMSRLLVFIDQDNPDYADDAYNLNQAKIAVGSGEVTGKGFGNATQSSGGFLPESATDFIFCVYAEQFGFLGSVILLGLYLALLGAALSVGLAAGDLFGTLITAGVMAMWLFQIMENIGMDLGLMPITGIPLPFMSYGSSFMITNFICVGLLCSVWGRRMDVGGNAKTRKAGLSNAQDAH